MKIGVFDSGLGGLAILKEILKVLPEYDYVYFGDNARVPYGGRSAELVFDYTKKAVEFLLKNDCILVILACNTATATALRRIQKDYLPQHYPQRRVLGVIRPTIEEVIKSHARRVGIIGTYATVLSGSFIKELIKIDSSLKIYQAACPLLVPVIEEGEYEWEGLELLLQKYLDPLKKQNIDSLILGCTHYGLIETQIKRFLGDAIKVFSEGSITAKKLKDYLQRHPEIEKLLSKKGERTYFVTDLNDRYSNMAELFMGEHFGEKDRLTSIIL
ncbi:glutamate racemase [Candidatus Roizmanbacteria bacterium]|nr:glutamate racemase [Candidatus Roizmanbacteria bacterium]